MTSTTTILLLLLIAILWMLTVLFQMHMMDELSVGQMRVWQLPLSHHLFIALIISRTDEQELCYQLALIRV